MINLLNCEWVMASTPTKDVCYIATQANIKLLAKRLQLAGNQNYVETFFFKRVNSPVESTTLPVTDYEINESHCYIKFGEANFGIGMVEILGMEQ